MPVTLTINGRTIEAEAGPSVFDLAERLGVRVPTSCHKQGKCKECMVEISEGQECLSARGEAKKHLKGAFRMSCRAQIVTASGQVRCYTMWRGKMRSDRRTFLGDRRKAIKQDSAGRDAGARIHP